MFAILAGFLIANFAVPSERDKESLPENIIYKGTFTWEKSDGTEEEITVPGNYDLPAKETMVITTQLPSDYDASIWLFVLPCKMCVSILMVCYAVNMTPALPASLVRILQAVIYSARLLLKMQEKKCVLN